MNMSNAPRFSWPYKVGVTRTLTSLQFIKGDLNVENVNVKSHCWPNRYRTHEQQSTNSNATTIESKNTVTGFYVWSLILSMLRFYHLLSSYCNSYCMIIINYGFLTTVWLFVTIPISEFRNGHKLHELVNNGSTRAHFFRPLRCL